MSEKKHVMLLISVMVFTTMVTSVVTFTLLYKAALREETQQLMATVKSQRRLIEAIIEHETRYIHTIPDSMGHGTVFDALLNQLRSAYTDYRWLGESGEFTLAKLENNNIVFLLHHQNVGFDSPQSIPFSSDYAEPMRRALSGLSGQVTGLDYHGETVLAAYEPITNMGLGVVAKIDLSEIRHPFIRAGFISAGIALIMIFGGTVLFFGITNPMRRAIVESKRKLEILLSNLPGMAYRCPNEPDWPMEYVSEGCKELTGCDELFLKGKKLNYGDLIHPDDKNYVWETVQEAVKKGRPFEMEYRIKTLDGKEKWVWERGLNIIEEKGGSAVLEGFITDITEHKLADQKRYESEERYRMLFNTARDAIFLSTYSENEGLGKTVEMNENACNILGFTRDELSAMTILDLMPESEQDRAEKIFSEFSEKQAALFIINLRAKGNKLIPFEISAHLFEFKNQSMCFSIARDITERKQAEKALSSSEEKFKQLANLLPQAVFEMDVNGRLTYSNQFAFESMGYTVENFNAGFSVMQVIAPVDRQRAEQKIMHIMQGEIPTGNEYQMQRKDGSTFPALIYSRPITEGGKVTGLRGIIVDITERKQLENQLFQAQKMEGIGKLAGGIAHDFNNILTVITGNTELALSTLDLRDPLRDDLFEVYQAGMKASELTRQLLAFSRKQTLQPRVLDLNKVIENLSKMLFRIIGEDIEFSTNLAGDLWKVQVDPGQIEQVIINLFVNARDAMPEGGRLLLETQNVELDEEYVKLNAEASVGKHVMIALTDSGSGIPEDTLRHIFEPFFTTKEEGKGTGLGLSTVYGIIKQSGGHINVYSDVGHGTTFKVYLPMVSGEVDESEEVVGGVELPRGNETIMIVEDEASVRKFACRILKQQGYNIVEASNGGEAYLIFKELGEKVDLLLTDVKMPKMGGKTLAQHLMDISPDLKVIYMSGYTENGITETGILDKDTPYLQKPFRPIDVAWKVRRVLDTGKENKT